MDSLPSTLLPNVDPTRVGSWLQTFTGRCFWPLDPRPAEINILDIAHALSMKCRYAGHCTKFYSIAEHSILVSQFVPPEFALWGLLHDAAEAYSADVPKPLKGSLTEWAPMEACIMAAVCTKFGLDPVEPDAVKDIDFAILADEKKVLMSPCNRDWGTLPTALGANIRALTPEAAKQAFLMRFVEL